MSRMTYSFDKANIDTLKDTLRQISMDISSPSSGGALLYVTFVAYTQEIRKTIETAFADDVSVRFSENPRQTEVRITPIR